MPRKGVKKAASSSKSRKNENIERLLVENTIALQKVLTNLSIKIDQLSTNFSKILDVFEISAKALAEKDFDIGGGGKDTQAKLDKLLDQNKVLAKGIAFLHEDYVGDEELKEEKAARKAKRDAKKEGDLETTGGGEDNSGKRNAAINMGDYEKSISTKSPTPPSMAPRRIPPMQKPRVMEDPSGEAPQEFSGPQGGQSMRRIEENA